MDSTGLRRAATVLTCVMATAALLVATAGTGAAQSAFVNAIVRTTPALPQPGQNVTVSVRVTGCPPGSTNVEVLLAANPQGGVAGALMADGPARTSLLWRTKARIELTKAVQGWYGVRVQCGDFRPAEVPMANTTFAVGADPITTMSVGSRTVTQGGSISISGDHCPGASVDYEIVPREHNGDIFLTTASIPTKADGTWSSQVSLPIGLSPGPALVRARCVEVNQLGVTVYTSYGTPLDLRIQPAS
jgi:hypothetical protein